MSKNIVSFFFLSLFIFATSVLAMDQGNKDEYALAVGQKGLPRLLLQHQLLEPYTEKHLKEAGLSGEEGKNKIVYDIGCGPGLVTVELAKRARHVYAVDTKQDQLTLAKERIAAAGLTNVTFIFGDIRDLKDLPEEGNVDVAYIRCVLAHVNNPQKIVEVTKSLLKKGGVVASQEPIISTFWEPSKHPVFCEWRKGTEDAGKKIGNNYNIGEKLDSFYRKNDFNLDIFYFVQHEIDASTMKKLFLLDIMEWPKAIEIGVVTQGQVNNWEKTVKAWPENDPTAFCLAKFAFLLAKKM